MLVHSSRLGDFLRVLAGSARRRRRAGTGDVQTQLDEERSAASARCRVIASHSAAETRVDCPDTELRSSGGSDVQAVSEFTSVHDTGVLRP